MDFDSETIDTSAISAIQSLEQDKLREEILKVKADRAKLELEIRELGRWWRPSVLQPIVTIVLFAGGTIYGGMNGWFSTNLERLKLEEDKLTFGNTTLAVQNRSLATKNRELDEGNKAFEQERGRLDNETRTLRDQLQASRSAVEELRTRLKNNQSLNVVEIQRIITSMLATSNSGATTDTVPVAVAISGGDHQKGFSGHKLPVPIRARSINRSGYPVAGTLGTWAITEGSATLTNVLNVSNLSGDFSADVQLGQTKGPVTVRLSVAGAGSVDFHLANEGDEFAPSK